VNPEPLTADFARFKEQTEALWANAELDPRVYGYQIRRGTRWNPGLRMEEIDAYELALGVSFPASFRRMIALMNGTDLPTINLYGSSGIVLAWWAMLWQAPATRAWFTPPGWPQSALTAFWLPAPVPSAPAPSRGEP
jgi:hypothetical protein